MSRWWRAYDDAVDHPKLLLLTDRQHRAWFNLLCVASAYGGTLPDIKVIAVKLRTTAAKAQALVDQLRVAELIDEVDGKLQPHDWTGRQFRTDGDPSNAGRQKRYRDRHRNADRNVTRNVTVTAPRDRVQNTETDSEPIGSAAGAAPEPVGEEPKAKLFRVGKTALVSWGIAERRTGALIGQWLKAKNDPIGLLAAIQYARDQNVADPVAYVSSLVHSKDPAHGQSADRTPRNGGDLARELAAEVREREREAGLFGPADAVRGH